jgi:periplasmic protein TonB
MSYSDAKEMTPARMWSIIIVVLVHVIIGYALVKGGYNVVKKVAADLNTFDVKDEPPPPVEPPPPPPPDKNIPPPPVVSPPPIVNTNQAPPPVVTQSTPPPVFVPTPEPPRPVPPPPPPKPQVATKAVLRGGSISDEDYPPAAVRNEESGTSAATFTIGTDGRVVSCNASGASASLDAETCKLILRRFRFKAALDASGQPIAETRTQRVTWRLPK